MYVAFIHMNPILPTKKLLIKLSRFCDLLNASATNASLLFIVLRRCMNCIISALERRIPQVECQRIRRSVQGHSSSPANMVARLWPGEQVSDIITLCCGGFLTSYLHAIPLVFVQMLLCIILVLSLHPLHLGGLRLCFLAFLLLPQISFSVHLILKTILRINLLSLCPGNLFNQFSNTFTIILTM